MCEVKRDLSNEGLVVEVDYKESKARHSVEPETKTKQIVTKSAQMGLLISGVAAIVVYFLNKDKK